MDKLKTTLQHRISVYDVVKDRFALITDFPQMSAPEVTNAAQALMAFHRDELSDDFPDEFEQFVRWYSSQQRIRPKNAKQTLQPC